MVTDISENSGIWISTDLLWEIATHAAPRFATQEVCTMITQLYPSAHYAGFSSKTKEAYSAEIITAMYPEIAEAKSGTEAGQIMGAGRLKLNPIKPCCACSWAAFNPQPSHS